jgi:hypothetical protein
MFSRRPPDSTKPPVPGRKLCVYCRTPASKALAVVCITRSSDTAVLGQLLRVDLDVALLEALAEDVDLRDPGDPQQPLADLPVGDRGHLDQVQALGLQADLHDPAGRRQRRHHPRRRRPGRQAGGDLRQALLHELACLQLVRAAVEDQPDRGELGDGLGPQVGQARDPVELLLERDGDELLDLVGRVAQRDRLDLDLRRRELGEDVDLGVRESA